MATVQKRGDSFKITVSAGYDMEGKQRRHYMGVGKCVYAALRLLGQLVQRFSSGIGKTQHPSDLIEAFSGGVVPGGAQNAEIGIILHVRDQRVAAGDGQRQKRRFQCWECQIVGGDMTPDMMDGDQRLPQGKSHGLRKAQPHKHRADQPWRVGDRHRVDVILSTASVLQRPLRQGCNGLHMRVETSFTFVFSVMS